MSQIEENNAVNIHDSIESAVAGAMGKESAEDILLEELENLKDFHSEDFETKSSCCAKLKSKIGLIAIVLLILFIGRKICASRRK
ncbi:hypothetical protein FAI41_06970 [Acetobacteraceae bacterium]|nr:hypothetical protein FAI41_06970 [Acetobacteraceae bacterium]